MTKIVCGIKTSVILRAREAGVSRTHGGDPNLAGLADAQAPAHRRASASRENEMAEYRFCTVEDEGRLRIVTINRPEVMNALHSEAHWEFDRVWNEFAADPELWVGIITGA